jgi:AraC-like DNA-binding protein
VRSDTGEVTGLIGISKDVRSPIAPQEIPGGVASALRRLEHDYAEPLGPADLAKTAQLSPVRFARIIKRVYGLTPTQLISKHRLSAASAMLRETSRSVSEIALDCGFHDHSAFTRAFRTAMGITPSEFRSVG